MVGRKPSGVISSVASVIGNLKRRRPALPIQIEHAADRLDLRHVRMAGDDDIDAERNGIDLQGLEIVHDEDGSVGKPHELGFGIFAGPVARVHVSSDRGDRRDPLKSSDDVGTSDIAAVNDVIHAGQTTFRFRPQQAVRVRDYADPEHQCSRG